MDHAGYAWSSKKKLKNTIKDFLNPKQGLFSVFRKEATKRHVKIHLCVLTQITSKICFRIKYTFPKISFLPLRFFLLNLLRISLALASEALFLKTETS